MKKTKVISTKNMPFRLPIYQTLVAWLVLERMDASGWIYGAVGMLFVFVWIIAICGLIYSEQVSVLGGGHE